MILKIQRAALAITVSIIYLLLFMFANCSSASAVNDNPFETNPKLYAYAKKAIQAVQAKDAMYVEVVRVDEKEMEDVYQHLRGYVSQPLPIWQFVLLDYPRLRLLRNEIYALHGRVFQSDDLGGYFRKLSWYKPDTAFSEAKLSKIEKDNISKITRMEYIKFSNRQFLSKIKFKEERDNDGHNEKSIYAKEVGGHIFRSYTGCCGVVEGTTRIQGSFGNGFSTSFGSEITGNGDVDYFIPYWGKNLVAWVTGEIKDKTIDSNTKMNDRIAVLDSNGNPLLDTNLPYETLPSGDDLKSFVLIEPDMLYTVTIHESSQALVFLKKVLRYESSIGNLYQWRPIEYTTTELESNFVTQKQNIRFSPIRNPATLWSKELFVGGRNPVVARNKIIFTKPENELREIWQRGGHGLNWHLTTKFDVVAIDKLTGKQLWLYKTPAFLESFALKGNLLAVKYHTGLALLDSDSGNLLWAVNTDISDKRLDVNIYEYQQRTTLLIGTKSLIVASSELFIEIYDLKNGNLIKRVDMRTLDPRIADSGYPSWYSTNKIAILSLAWNEGQEPKDLKGYRLFLAIDFEGNFQWISSLPRRRDKLGLDDIDTGKIAANENSVLVYDYDYLDKAFYLDPSTGKQTGNKFIIRRNPDFSLSLNDILKYNRSFNQINKKVILSDRASYPCKPSLLNDYVYAWDNYNSLTTILLLDSCLSRVLGLNDEDRYYAHRESYWSYAPWQTNWEKTHEAQNAKIIFVDNNFILVEVKSVQLNGLPKISYWALGELALRDYVIRTDGDVYKEVGTKSH